MRLPKIRPGDWVSVEQFANEITTIILDEETTLSDYILADGSRPFTGTISGITPTSSSHLTTKDYVDALVSAQTHVMADITDLDHDGLPGFVANEHIDWTNASDDFETSGQGTFGGVVKTSAEGSPYFIATGWEAAANLGPKAQFQRSHNNTKDTHTLVQNGDVLGTIEWQGSDGNEFDLGASVTGIIDGTPSNEFPGDMPTKIVLSTAPEGSVVPVSRMEIRADGTVEISGTLDPSAIASPTSVGTLTLASGSITDSSGAISFGNENLSTQGNLTVGVESGAPTVRFWGTTEGHQCVWNGSTEIFIVTGTGINTSGYVQAGSFSGTSASCNIGVSGDTDLLQLTASNLAVNGAVAATGAVTGANLSGTNTGDQDVVDDTSPQLGGDLDGQSTYDLTNMVDADFSGTVAMADNAYVEFGAGDGSGGDLGCDAQIYSDGNDVVIQIESATGASADYTNPSMTIKPFDILDGVGAYVPAITFPRHSGYGVIDHYLYVRDTSGGNANPVILLSKGTDYTSYLGLIYDISNSYAQISTSTITDLRIGDSDDNVSVAYRLRVGSNTAPTCPLDVTGDAKVAGTTYTQNVEPLADDTYYIGKNDDDSPAAYKGIILKDQTDGKYYRIELNNGAVSVVDLTD